MNQPIARVVDLVDSTSLLLGDLELEAARNLLFHEDPGAVLALHGSFALWARRGVEVRLARSLDRPLRYFLAKVADGPLLVIAERIDAIADYLKGEGLAEQFHPSYTRMVPAHHVTSLQLIGCPDPNPQHRRFFAPPRATLAADLDLIGERYVSALLAETRRFLERQDKREPIGVLFSGGIDSGAVLMALNHELLALGQSPARLKAFTLAIDGGGSDARQSHEFLRRAGLEMLHEIVEVDAAAVDPLAAIALIEDYKPLDVECAAVLMALLAQVRERYPTWRLLADGDGGDENLKDYPIEENRELTIRSVVNNSMLYQEGWGVDAIKHSATYSGGLSRGCVRSFAPLRHFGFVGFSPFLRPALIEVAEAIPFAELCRGDHDRLYQLKGEVIARGFKRLLGIEFPAFPKKRFQDGATSRLAAEDRARQAQRFRGHFLNLFAQ
jgi:asparagine synthase (glutamine-hydrolysing)